MGLAYAQQRDLHRAESEWREAVRIKPDMTEAHRLIAGLEISRGEVVLFMDSDDMLDPTAIAEAVALLEADVAKVQVDYERAQNEARGAQAELARARLALAFMIGVERAAALRPRGRAGSGRIPRPRAGGAS